MNRLCSHTIRLNLFFFCWVTFVILLISAACPNMRKLNKNKKRKVTPRIKRSSNNLVQFALCAACLSQHDFTNAWVPHSHSFTPGTSRKRCNRLVFPIFRNSQEVKSIGSSHNRSALPFSGFGSTVVTSHYNSPAGLYSSENIRDFNSAVDEVKTMTTAPEANTK